jgi:hypothetical protein
MLMRRRFVAGVAATLIGAGFALSAVALLADSGPSLSVNPSSVSELYYRPSPIAITVNASGLNGPGIGPVGAYQYGLQWDPTVLQWISGPDVGPGTPTPSAGISRVR